MKKDKLYDANDIHIGYTKTYADGTIVYLNLYYAIHRSDGPAVIEPTGIFHHNYITWKNKYSCRYHKWRNYGGKVYNKEPRELWFMNNVNYHIVEEFPMELYNAYCLWHYKKHLSGINASSDSSACDAI